MKLSTKSGRMNSSSKIVMEKSRVFNSLSTQSKLSRTLLFFLYEQFYKNASLKIGQKLRTKKEQTEAELL